MAMTLKPEWRVVRIAGCLLVLTFVLASVAYIIYTTKSVPMPGSDSHAVTEINGRNITQSDMNTLKPGEWLSDEIVDAYMYLLDERSARKSACFDSQFFNYLTVKKFGDFTRNYKTVQQWYDRNKLDLNHRIPELTGVYNDYRARKAIGAINDDGLNIFDLDLVLIPIERIESHGNHWTLMSLNMNTKTAEYYDSLGWKDGKAVWTYLKLFLQHVWMFEHPGNNGINYINQWKFKEYTHGNDMPKQSNRSDSGVFVCKTAEYLLDRKELTFTQSDMETFRKRMVLDLLRKRIGD
eukprot:224653_1